MPSSSVNPSRIDIEASDRAALDVARESRLVLLVERGAVRLARAWRTSSSRDGAASVLAEFQALSVRERVLFGTTALATAAVTHLVLRWL